MAIFKKTEPQTQKPSNRPATPSRGGTPDGAISIIGNGMSVIGDISTEGIVRVEGEVRGTIRAGKAIILGQGGVIDGNVYTDDAVIGGTVRGSIVAENRLELQATCSVEGEIHTRPEHLKLEEGARFAGQVHMLEPQVTEEPAPTGFQSGPVSPVYTAPPAVLTDRAEQLIGVDDFSTEDASDSNSGEGDEGEDSDHQRRKKA